MEDILATHKQVEHTLRYLAAIAEQADEGVAVFDPAGVVLFVNPAWAGMHGYRTTDELIGRPMSVFHTEEQMQAGVMAFIEEARRTGQRMGLVEHVTSDGTPFSTQTKVIVVSDEAGRATGLVAFAADITQRRQLEERLRDHSRRTAQFTEQIARLQELFAECREVEQFLTKQAVELEADGHELRQRIAEWAQSQQMPRQHANALLQQKPKSAAPLAPPSREKTEHKQAADMPRPGSERTPRPRARQYPLDTEELRKVAELGRRLASLS